jgi:hypothetical protein
MELPRMSVKSPAGFSFNTPDLVILRAWSDFHDLDMVIELDVSVDGAEYEELVGLYDRTQAFRCWTFWRSRDGIVVRPAPGRAIRFDSMPDALEQLIPTQD